MTAAAAAVKIAAIGIAINTRAAEEAARYPAATAFALTANEAFATAFAALLSVAPAVAPEKSRVATVAAVLATVSVLVPAAASTSAIACALRATAEARAVRRNFCNIAAVVRHLAANIERAAEAVSARLISRRLAAI